MFSRCYIPLGMYRSVEKEAPTESSHSVGMQPCDLPNGGIPTECPFVWEHNFLPSDASLRLAKHDITNVNYELFYRAIHSYRNVITRKHKTDWK
ncbi:MAG: hypothetical protein LBQ66_13360 [Planctomycetaceae bacterium]|jgi:hypothetical protein|nr:hypothetical protein [Planctomycetaceae bacterium]